MSVLRPKPQRHPLDFDQLRALVIGSYGRFCKQRDWDVDDLVHDVAVVILERQFTASAYDARRSAWTTYVTLVTRGVVMNRLERQGVESKHAWRFEPDETHVPSPDGRHLDDEQLGKVRSVLEDARSALSPVAFDTVQAWLTHERDVTVMARQTGVSELDLWRYLVLQLSALGQARKDGPWFELWERQRAYARRRLQQVRSQHEVHEGRSVGVGAAGRRGDRRSGGRLRQGERSGHLRSRD